MGLLGIPRHALHGACRLNPINNLGPLTMATQLAKSDQVTQATKALARTSHLPQKPHPLGGGCRWSDGASTRLDIASLCGQQAAGHLAAHTDVSLCSRPDLRLLAPLGTEGALCTLTNLCPWLWGEVVSGGKVGEEMGEDTQGPHPTLWSS